MDCNGMLAVHILHVIHGQKRRPLQVAENSLPPVLHNLQLGQVPPMHLHTIHYKNSSCITNKFGLCKSYYHTMHLQDMLCQWIFQQSSKDPIFKTMFYIHGQITLHRDWDHQHSQRTCVARWKSSCDSIVTLAMRAAYLNFLLIFMSRIHPVKYGMTHSV
jgi:hypothetical protein